MSGRLFLAAALALAFGRPTEAEAGGLVLSAEAPGVQATSQTNVTTETFDEFTPNGAHTSISSTIGTFTSPGMAIVSANEYGGAGRTGNYFAVGAESGPMTATLTLNGPQNVFGFLGEAADPYNVIQFYNGTQLLGSFNPTTALGSLASNPAYHGDPNNRSEDSSEIFADIDVTDMGGPGITSVVIQNTSLGTGCEIDNMSISNTDTMPTGSTPIPNGITAVAEPHSLVLLGRSVILGAIGYGLRRYFTTQRMSPKTLMNPVG